MSDLRLRISALASERASLLRGLAREANAAHASARWSAGTTISYVVAAGNALANARDLCEDGEWGAWVRANFEGSMRTAQRYVKAARAWPERVGDATRVSRPSQRSALGAVRGLLFAPPRRGACDALFGTDPGVSDATVDAQPQLGSIGSTELTLVAYERLTLLAREIESLARVGDEATASVVARLRSLAASFSAEISVGEDGADSWVYVIEATGADRMKIGVSSDPERRLVELQTGSSTPLRLVGKIRGGRGVERALQARFSAFHLGGEWFHMSRWVRSLIGVLVGGEAAVDLTGQPTSKLQNGN